MIHWPAGFRVLPVQKCY